MHHLDPKLLHAVLEGDLPMKALVRQLVAHLTELCPECEQTMELLRPSIAEGALALVPGGPSSSARDGERPGNGHGVSDRLIGVGGQAERDAEELLAKVRRERRKARRQLAELLRLPANQRAGRVERARQRFRSRAVAELLFEESRRRIREDPEEARSLVSLVPTILLWTPGALGQDWARELDVRARAWVANTMRVSHDYRGAERAFEELRARMARELVDEGVHAEVDSLEASLRIDQRRHEEARQLLDRAATLYRLAGESEPLARVLSKRAIVEGRVGDLEAAASFQRESLSIFEVLGDARHVIESAINLTLYLAEGGKGEEGAAVLERYESVFRRERLWEEARAQVIRGRIALAAGRQAEAEELFLTARAELIRRGDAVRAAVTSLDLAALYLVQGKTADLRRMARLMGSIFESVELESDALATVVLFQKAVAADSVTQAAIQAWRRQLEVGRPPRRKEPVS